MIRAPQAINTYKSIPEGTYALKRDFNASTRSVYILLLTYNPFILPIIDRLSGTRLTAQHYLWKDALNFNLHPSIPVDRNSARIADVATGNGSVKPHPILVRS